MMILTNTMNIDKMRGNHSVSATKSLQSKPSNAKILSHPFRMFLEENKTSFGMMCMEKKRHRQHHLMYIRNLTLLKQQDFEIIRNS